MKKNFTFNLVLGFCLAYIGGFIDAYSLANRGFFSCLQTGNFISIVSNLIRSNWNSLIISVIVVVTFIIGLFLSNLLEFYFKKRNKDYHPVEFLIAAFLLCLTIFIPVEFTQEEIILQARDLSWPNVVGNLVLALIGAMLLESFRKMDSKNFTATMMTANMQRMVSSFFEGETNKEKDNVIAGIDYIFVLLCFALGVASSYSYYYFLNPYFETDSNYWKQLLPNLILIIPIIILVVLFIINYLKNKKKSQLN